MSETAHNFEQPEPAKPALAAIEGEGRSDYIDPEHLPLVEEIDLNGILEARGHGIGDSPEHTKPLDAKMCVRVLVEGAEGSMEDGSFDRSFEFAVGTLLEGSVSTDEISDLYDLLEIKSPRLIQLLRRVREEGYLQNEQLSTVSRLCLIFLGRRHLGIE